MGTENFHASVQYNDMTGTAAADRHDTHYLEKYLVKQGLIQEDEFLVGVEMWSGEVQGENQNEPVSITAFVTSREGYDTIKAAVASGKPLQVRKIRFDMPLNGFFGLFKRFSISISNSGVIDGRDITYDD